MPQDNWYTNGTAVCSRSGSESFMPTRSISKIILFPILRVRKRKERRASRGCTEELVAHSEMGRRPMSESTTNSSVHPLVRELHRREITDFFLEFLPEQARPKPTTPCTPTDKHRTNLPTRHLQQHRLTLQRNPTAHARPTTSTHLDEDKEI
jgi:hypothetical protein